MNLPRMDATWAQRAFYAVAAAGILAGVAMAVQGALAGYPYWYDEMHSLVTSQQPVVVALQQLVLPDVHPPLYYGLLALWSGLFSTGAVATRLLSLLACLGTLGLLWGMGRAMLSHRALALAFLWLASHWLWITYAQEVRMYSFVLLGGAWVSFSFARLWCREDAPPLSSLLFFSVGCLLVAFLHYSAMAFACSALLLLLFRHRRRLSFWPPIAAVGIACVLWTLWHVVHQAAGGWVGQTSWGGWPGPAALLATLWTVLFPGRIYEFGPVPTLPLVAVWLFFAGFYAVLLVQWRRRVRQEGGWGGWKAAVAGKEWDFLRSQLRLLGVFFAVLALVHEWRAILVYKMLMASLPALALCFGAWMVLLWRREYWRLCVLALALAAVSLPVSWYGVQKRWTRWSLYDGEGVQEIAARLAAADAGVRVYCYLCGSSSMMLRPQYLAMLTGVQPGVFAPVHLRGSESNSIFYDEHHLRPPFFVANMLRERLAALQARQEWEIEVLGPGNPYHLSLYVWERE